jgi:DNA-binding LacI/PurR family transcriptional regulator
MKFSRVTLRQQVQDSLRKDIIEHYQPGDRLLGERPLAEKLGVSIVTLREALQCMVSEKLIVRHQGKGTFVLKREAEGQDLPIGVLVDVDVGHPNTSPSQLRFGIAFTREMEKRGHKAVLFLGTLKPGDSSEDPTSLDARKALEEHSIKALIVVCWTSPTWRTKFELAGIPVVRFGGDCPSGVQLDYPFFVSSAIDDLVEKGCRRLALLSWEGVNGEYASLISQVFRDQLMRKGLEVREPWITHSFNPNLTGAGWEAFREIWRGSEGEKPDGILITDDSLLRGALLAIHELRIRVPEQLALATMVLPDCSLGEIVPSAVYEIPIDKIAGMIADLTEARLRDRDLPSRKLLVHPVRRVAETGECVFAEDSAT